MNARDAEGGNQTHVKELYAIISLQLLITPADFSAFVTRERAACFTLQFDNVASFLPGEPELRTVIACSVGLYRGISNSIGASFASDALPSTSLVTLDEGFER